MSARRAASRALAAASAVIAGCSDDGVVSRAPAEIASCVAPVRPNGTGRVELVPALPGVVLDDSVALVWPPDPSDDHGYVVAQSGTLWRFDRDVPVPAAVVDLTDEVAFDGESGFLDFVLHPAFPATPHGYFSYVSNVEDGLVSRIARMESTDGGATFDRATERILLEVPQPYSNHKGGELAFGPDGYLYFGLGDGGSAGDPHGNGQNLDVLLGKMLRIDVDGDEPYGIPPDNPFAAGGGRPEIYAVGLRNPWRFSFDSRNGDLWVGDVGQSQWEEVDRIRPGGNYGWSVMEGTTCFAADTCDAASFDPPVTQYRNTGGASVIGGVVIRGGELPELEGTYLFSDFFDGTITGIRPDGAVVPLGSGAAGVAAWSRDEAGGVWALHYGGGISRLAIRPEGPPDTFPRKLSETHCVDVDHPREAAPGTDPYEVALSFWSDGADKLRFIHAGDGEVVIGQGGDWDLPNGTVVVKSFFRGDTPIETRLLVRHDDGGWAGYGYAWRADGSDADYVEEGFADARVGQPWVFPSTRECDACHTEAAGHSLGLTTTQLAIGDQLADFAERGLIDGVPAGIALPAIDGDAPVAERARAYLDVNCSMCHRPKGPAGRAQIDLRWETAFLDTGLCVGAPRGGNLGLDDATLLTPGDPARSIVSLRLHATGDAHMPPIGIASVDEAGAAVVDEWIRSLDGCL